MNPFKEQFIREHDALVEEYVSVYGEAHRHEAYDLLSDAAYDRARDHFADLADAARTRRKEEG